MHGIMQSCVGIMHTMHNSTIMHNSMHNVWNYAHILQMHKTMFIFPWNYASSCGIMTIYCATSGIVQFICLCIIPHWFYAWYYAFLTIGLIKIWIYAFPCWYYAFWSMWNIAKYGIMHIMIPCTIPPAIVHGIVHIDVWK